MERNVSRHEIKYLISTFEAELLKRRLPLLLQTDSNAWEDGSYFIRSVYFDDPYFTAYNEKLSGVKERTKYRIRFYNFDDSFILLERKSKDGDLTGKDSVRIDRALAERFLHGDDSLRALPGLAGEFGRLRQGAYKPVCIVDYDRFAYKYPVGNVRVTLDTAVRTSPFRTGLFDRQLVTVPVLESGEVVLEVKYDDVLPAQVGALLEGVKKQRSAVSKYTKCLGILE